MNNTLTQGLNNIGSWTQYGYRVGPVAVNAKQRGGAANLYGQGMPYSPIFTYSLIPGSIGTNNILATTTLDEIPGWLQLPTSTVVGDYVVTPYYAPAVNLTAPSTPQLPLQSNNLGTLALQLQYPAVLQFTSDVSAPVYITVFGYDWYGQPIQNKLTLTDGTVTTPSAFYGVTGIWNYGGANAVGMTVSGQSTATYGLPYALHGVHQTIAFGFSGVTPPPVPISPLTMFTAWSPTSTSATSGDVRGLVTLPSPNIPDDTSEIVATYFVAGANAWQAVTNKIANGGNPSGLPWPQGPIESVPQLADLIGPVPFYTGFPT